MHISVLLNEVITALDIQPNDVILDATVGGGGYSQQFAKKLDKRGALIAIDQDASALAITKNIVGKTKCQTHLIQSNFRDLDKVLNSLNIPVITKAVFDLGLSSNQLETSLRGFSFQKDEPLIMTFNDSPDTHTLTAAQIVNQWSGDEITKILKEYGEEKLARRITENILKTRKIKRIVTTKELAEIIIQTVPQTYRHSHIHPATKTFQALRIAVNDELNTLSEGLNKAFMALYPKGRMAVVSFHSLEDRLVKKFFLSLNSSQQAILLNRKPIIPTNQEIIRNRRSRSAKLRAIEKV